MLETDGHPEEAATAIACTSAEGSWSGLGLFGFWAGAARFAGSVNLRS